ncbi:caspase-1-like isoform X2 [Lasioglossum baleicum]|uniref:caspase-1-like isoform X2 n=1 Tax=Lasioglossum baleicum TaxID=434251 RepID=UPI003FCEDA20
MDKRQPKVAEQKQQRTDEIERQPEQCDSSSIQPGPSNVDGWMLKKPKEYNEPRGSEGVQTQVPPDSEVYYMNHKRRGVALIFNHIHFKKMSTRNGSIKDCKDLTRSLNKLGFEIREYVDCTVQAAVSILKTTAAEDHTDADCLIVVTMSHGESGLVYAADTLYPVDMLWAPFTGDRCSTLVGKPKLFFIQACRGARLDSGVQMRVTHDTDGTDVQYRIPAQADIMIAYSTYDGFYSWRNPDSGAWFIQALCEELNQNGRTRDLLTIMTFVNRRVAIQYQSFVPHDEHFHQKKQIPSIVSMLTRLVYFGGKPL